jgi:ferredoxin
LNPFRVHEEKSYWVDICLAGDAAVTRQVCREHCMKVGLCVTVTPTEYIYTGGQEAGVIVRLVNYPRFPCSDAELEGKAQALAQKLADALCQWSVLIQTPKTATWLDRKPDETRYPERKGQT